MRGLPDDSHLPPQRRKLSLLLVLVGVVLATLLAFQLQHSGRHRSPGDGADDDEALHKGVCTTQECVVTAGRILSAINASADPCEDFFEYSCGGWLADNPIPEDKSQVGTFDSVSEKNLRLLKDILEGPYPGLAESSDDSDKQNFEKAKGFYSSCKDVEGIEKTGIAPLVDLVKRATAKFPLGDGEKLDAAKAVDAIVQAHSVGVNPLFAMIVGADDKEPDVNVINLFQGGLTLPSREYYEKKDFTEVLRQTVENVLKVVLPEAGGDWKEDGAARAAAVTDLEAFLARFSLPNSAFTDPSALYNVFTPHTLEQASPNIPWEAYLKGRFASDRFPADLIKKDTTKLIVQAPTFYGNLSTLFTTTKPQAFEDYVIWHYVLDYAERLPQHVRSLFFPLFEKTGQRASVEPPRWRTCLALTDAALGELAGKWFVEKAFGGDSKKAASQTVENIEKAFLKRLPHIEWLDKATRERAIKKVKSLVTKIGYADIILQPDALAEKYKHVPIDPIGFFLNIVHVQAWEVLDNLQDILRKVDKARWGMTPATVNAYYNPTMNEIVFPAGILQPPFYHLSFPAYLSYGGIGVVVGHELTHAFDNMGSQYDENGKLEDWWSEETKREFERKAKCFVEEYEKWGVTGPDGREYKIDGTLTLGENLADNGGLARAYEAWKADLHSPGGHKRNPMLPGFGRHATKDQLFYVAFAQVWCSNRTPANALRRILTDPHSPAKYRVIGAVVNSREFSEAWRCKKGSGMNPGKGGRCEIW
ncbi:uncharacterized protein EV422DRAFT_348069 [Fimicolochytrium jonesii]|uniref:uncharacterized protein n=1 Tax=Fimicolochytrium jonesii TaxID=1396493 RepID=UPI0022FECC03|nr:uncharacterized protein EV422DRAFT_348069 [Fimicolochytrium jonesii]KAI8815669.1 hypothetical protein EV422DRAFT_348069 [Fimicolochytrium jonesii]